MVFILVLVAASLTSHAPPHTQGVGSAAGWANHADWDDAPPHNDNLASRQKSVKEAEAGQGGPRVKRAGGGRHVTFAPGV